MRRLVCLVRSVRLAVGIRGRILVALAIVAITGSTSSPAAAAPKPHPTPSSRWQGLSPLGVPGARRPATLPEPPRPPFPPPDQPAPPSSLAPGAASPPATTPWPLPTPPAPTPPPPPGRPNPARAFEAGLAPLDGPPPLSLESIGRMVGDLDDEAEPADGDGSPIAPGNHGLSLRLLAGPAHLSISTHSTDRVDSSRLAGWGLGIATTAGGWVAPGVALGATLAVTSVLDPTLTGTAIVQPVGPATLTTFALGLDLLYRIDPIATTVSLGALLEQIRLVDQSTSYVHSGTRLGPGLAAGLDKQWNLGGAWWIGAFARGSIAWPQDLRRSMSVTAVSVCFGLSLGYD